ncbi:MAG: hypothetical protein B6244_11270 [Candidatus Cloacimonetes bacterium 4572_55]|nr:MAG: hypothetical protein B6244_11270 [Candidatus Cloacimonetes bacterium 4572_55]
MYDQLIETIPEFSEIQNETLRKNAIAVWETALKEKGWTLETLKRMPFTILIEGVPITFIEHVRVVCQMSADMCDRMTAMYGDRIKIDRDYVVAGALLADVGKVWENDEIEPGKFQKSAHGKLLRHPFTGVMLGHRFNIPDEVLHMIATHSREGDHVKRTAESIIFHHADFTDFHVVGGGY